MGDPKKTPEDPNQDPLKKPNPDPETHPTERDRRKEPDDLDWTKDRKTKNK